MKHIPTYEELTGVQKEVCDLCRRDQKACDNNTDLCIAFWEMKKLDEWMDGGFYRDVIRKYPPESLVKYRRNLISWGLITPTKASREHSEKMEALNHKSPALINHTTEADRLFNILTF